jgi:hypothetical protein
MSWLATRNNNYSSCRFHIITGLNLAKELIDRIHNVKGDRTKTNPHIVLVSTPYKPGDLFVVLIQKSE